MKTHMIGFALVILSTIQLMAADTRFVPENRTGTNNIGVKGNPAYYYSQSKWEVPATQFRFRTPDINGFRLRKGQATFYVESISGSLNLEQFMAQASFVYGVSTTNGWDSHPLVSDIPGGMVEGNGADAFTKATVISQTPTNAVIQVDWTYPSKVPAVPTTSLRAWSYVRTSPAYRVFIARYTGDVSSPGSEHARGSDYVGEKDAATIAPVKITLNIYRGPDVVVGFEPCQGNLLSVVFVDPEAGWITQISHDLVNWSVFPIPPNVVAGFLFDKGTNATTFFRVIPQ